MSTRPLVFAVVALLAARLTACGGGSSPSAPAAALPSCGTSPISGDDRRLLSCPSLAEVETIRREIPITIVADPSAGTVGCRTADGSADLTLEQTRLYLQLLYMRRLAFHEPLPWTTKPLYTWFREAIRGISMEVGSGNSYCTPQERIIHVVFKADYTGYPPTLERVNPSGLIHEARHAEGPMHTCDYGTRDRTIAEMGAFGVQYWFLTPMATATDEPLEERQSFAYKSWSLRTGFCDECVR
jgi:hypothetical protein